MTQEPSTDLMDAIVTNGEDEMRGRLLKLIQEFLLGQLNLHAEKKRSTSLRSACLN
jgi:hypothetical protein